ncbi:MAG: 23S rRNA (pseudouridine(1915)-N(3))-methyltransferase RlmH [Lentisphaeria bacterium]|nr:23S rRNA (pseudouridine(1915)-N(3))-methyltransferase RlmH [Lentisphaeria bacterium]NQZ68071.1 23S rRNA (pseudouridine(1915)-N(3))-methyltransferase RlmH [Lentisphaeria bacterium]
MRDLHIIAVGKNTDNNSLSMEAEYLKRIKLKLSIHETKAHDENRELEAKDVLKKIIALEKKIAAKVILLTEKGTVYDSQNFSNFLFKEIENNQSPLILVIGGASGHGQLLYDRADAELSLSKLTFPHRMARVILVEQIYRAECIKHKHPYHK